MFIKKILLEKAIFFICLTTFCLLLFKDVFSERTLIPNFEPFPDTFHYVVPARNLLKGEGFTLSRESRALTSSVGPLYSIFLIPFYLINADPRMFYFANILLSISGLVIFYRILKKISSNIWINGTTILLFVTNYYLYWFPSLAMAENLLQFLILCGTYLLLLSVNYFNIIFAAVIGISFALNKYASASLTIIYLTIYSIKIYYSEKSKKYFFGYLILGIIMLIILGLFLFYAKQMNILKVVIYYLGIFNIINTTNTAGIFSVVHASNNLPLYINALLGGNTKVLWDTTPLLPNIVAILGLIGLVLGSLKSNIKLFCLSIIGILTISIFFISTFYSFDSRYILYIIPLLLIGFDVILAEIFKYLTKIGYRKMFYLLLIIFLSCYMIFNGLRLKKQIMLNIKYAETPWYYVSILEMNKYFTLDKIKENKKPILVSAISPYLIDYFSNNNFTLLPLSYDQEFRSAKEIVWGPNDYSDLPKLYTKYIKDGYLVYVDRYGLGNEIYTNRDFKVIENTFKLTKVVTGCFEQCNIYKVELKEK